MDVRVSERRIDAFGNTEGTHPIPDSEKIEERRSETNIEALYERAMVNSEIFIQAANELDKLLHFV